MGGGGSKKAPPAPDYTALMQQQQALDQQNFQTQLANQRTTQVTPQGTSSWAQGPNGQWTQTTSLSPELQQLYNTQLSNTSQAQNVQSTANSQLQALQAQGAWQPTTALPQFSQDYANQYANQMQQYLTAATQPQFQQDQNAMQTKLSLQGLQPGTQAYDLAYQNLLKSQQYTTSQGDLQAQLQGQQQAMSMYGTQLQGAQAANTLSMQQYLLPWQTASTAAGLAGNINMPSFSSNTTSTPTLANTDIVGAAQQTYAQQMQNYNQQASSSSAKGSSLGSLAGGIAGSFIMPGLGTAAGAALGGAAGGALSDLRLKENVVQMSDEEAFHRLLEIAPIQWNWRGLDIVDSGLAAQQVAERIPQLTDEVGGYLRINYTAYVAVLQGAFRHLAKELNTVDRRVS